MTAMDHVPERQLHWEEVYNTKSDDEVSWFQGRPQTSLDLFAESSLPHDAAIIDIGGGASRLVDALLDEDYKDLTVLDIAAAALHKTKQRLNERASAVHWIVADITLWQPDRRYALWHDRAVFHFLTSPEDRAAYKRALSDALPAGGIAILASFAPDGPERCSGLPVMRYSSENLARELGPAFALEAARLEEHLTPAGRVQKFQFSRFRRR
jgi:trans-aconitate methyltransferase